MGVSGTVLKVPTWVAAHLDIILGCLELDRMPKGPHRLRHTGEKREKPSECDRKYTAKVKFRFEAPARPLNVVRKFGEKFTFSFDTKGIYFSTMPATF